MRAQLSAEMLILIVVILAIVALVASQLTKSTQKTSASIENQSNIITKRSEEALRADAGAYCEKDEHCLSNKCDLPNLKCE